MSLNLKNVVIDSEATLGKGLMLVDAPRPAYVYENEKRTDEISGYNHQILAPGLSYEKITVKVPGTQPIIPPEEWKSGDAIPVIFTNLVLQLSQDYKTHAIRLWASADAIRLVEQKG